MKILVVIPARGGSKGLPGKNMKLLAGKPLICHSIDVARAVAGDEDICVSSDDWAIISAVESYGLRVPFVRPVRLASDEASTSDVLVHALEYYESQGRQYDAVLLLQPTSPLRTAEQVREAMALYSTEVDMVVSVKRSDSAAVLCREEGGYLFSALESGGGRRQDVGEYYEYNGAIYVINPRSLKEKGMASFTRRVKYVMPRESSFDIDDSLDWDIVDMLINSREI